MVNLDEILRDIAQDGTGRAWIMRNLVTELRAARDVVDAAEEMNITFEHSCTLAPDDRADDIRQMVQQRIYLATTIAHYREVANVTV